MQILLLCAFLVPSCAQAAGAPPKPDQKAMDRQAHVAQRHPAPAHQVDWKDAWCAAIALSLSAIRRENDAHKKAQYVTVFAENLRQDFEKKWYSPALGYNADNAKALAESLFRSEQLPLAEITTETTWLCLGPFYLVAKIPDVGTVRLCSVSDVAANAIWRKRSIHLLLAVGACAYCYDCFKPHQE
jgi:hypothetical protein